MDYPCKDCSCGWGQANPWGIDSCHDTCKKYWNWLEGDRKMDKPLKDWTLGEIKAECEKHEFCKPECPAYKLEGERHCRVKYSPTTWDLTKPPRWTEQEVEDAKKIKYLLPNAIGIGRQAGIIMLYVNRLDGSFTELKQDLFPSIQPGQEYTLDEIIGDEDNDS